MHSLCRNMDAYNFLWILRSLSRAITRHAWVFLHHKNTMESMCIMAHCNILWIPIGQLCMHLRQVRSWKGCGALFKATWGCQTSINTRDSATFPMWFKDSSFDFKATKRNLTPRCDSLPHRGGFYSEWSHWSLLRPGRQHGTLSNRPVT